MVFDLTDMQKQIKSAVSSTTKGFKLCQAEFDDMVQDVNLRVLTVGEGYDASKGAAARTWIYTIARNVALDTLRARTRHETAPLTDKVATTVSASVVISVVETEKAALLQDALHALSPDDEQFIRDLFSGVSLRAYAADHGMTYNAVAIRKHRIVKRLRAWMHSKIND